MTTVSGCGHLRAIGWDHPRCVRPMVAAAAAWQKLTGMTVDWDFRPLSAFNDRPIVELASGYDLLVIDHPAIPEAIDERAIRPLEDWIDGGVLASLRGDGLGPSAESYRYQGSVWALPVDGACHVSAGRREQFDQLPVTWTDAVTTIEQLGRGAALPLTPADSFCALLTIAATLDQPVSLDGPVSLTALEMLAWLGSKVHPCSWNCSPPALLKQMSSENEIVYVPLTFGYVTCSDKHVRFGDAPASSSGRRRPVLGGAGVAVSAASRRPADAAGFCS
jgi:multiple sugar transport system substrate-binding protein